MRRKPYSVILFDEIEKAHPDVFNLLLQILDDGRLTDGQGRTIDFKNTIIIMTSNLGSDLYGEIASQVLEFMEKDMKEKLMTILRQKFRPEFLNRIDEIVVFHNLTMENIKSIVDIQLGILKNRLMERKISVELTDKAKEFIANTGFDPIYGARPLKRTIQREIIDVLSEDGLRCERWQKIIETIGQSESFKFKVKKICSFTDLLLNIPIGFFCVPQNKYVKNTDY